MEIYVLLWCCLESDGWMVNNHFVAAGKTIEGLANKVKEKDIENENDEPSRIFMPGERFPTHDEPDENPPFYRIIKETVLE